MATTIFLSCSHKDFDLFQELKTHLAALNRYGFITWWHDGNIDAGSEWEKEIHQHLDRAEIILLLISPDFIASD